MIGQYTWDEGSWVVEGGLYWVHVGAAKRGGVVGLVMQWVHLDESVSVSTKHTAPNKTQPHKTSRRKKRSIVQNEKSPLAQNIPRPSWNDPAPSPTEKYI